MKPVIKETKLDTKTMTRKLATKKLLKFLEKKTSDDEFVKTVTIEMN